MARQFVKHELRFCAVAAPENSNIPQIDNTLTTPLLSCVTCDVDRPIVRPVWTHPGSVLPRPTAVAPLPDLQSQYAFGFDSQTGEYGNLVNKGIIDPTKVVRVAIQNAASVAALLITTEAMVAELPKKPAPAAAAAWAAWTTKSNQRAFKGKKKGPGSAAGPFNIGDRSISARWQIEGDRSQKRRRA